MIGGGQGAFIGAVHRLAAALDGQYELVAGAIKRREHGGHDSLEMAMNPRSLWDPSFFQ